MPKAKAPRKLKTKLASELVAYALSLPEAHEDFPWGERVAKVRTKVFVFFWPPEGAAFGFSVKLPHSGPFARDLPFVAPTGYGLGRSGWVSVTLEKGDEIDLDLAKAWVKESYLAVAPKTLGKLVA